MITLFPTLHKLTSPAEMSSSEYSEVSPSKANRPPKVLHPTLAFHDDRWRKQEDASNKVLLPGKQCPSFNTMAVMEDGETCMAFSDSSFQATYVVFFFFPMDKSVDYSELMAFKDNLEQFQSTDCQVVGVTSDSLVSILKWIKMEPKQGGTGGPVNFLILSDKTLDLAKKFGVKRPSGMPSRATFVLDKERKVRHCCVYPRVVGRSVEEVLRTVQAIKEVDKAIEEEAAEVSIPAGWNLGEEVIINTCQGKKEFYSALTMKKSQDNAKEEEIIENDDGGEMVTITSGPQVFCPIGNWFSKIPNQETAQDLSYFL